jgi:cytochrome c peroxidase
MGRYLVTGSSADIGKFKTPTLRNVALRNVFMHDGRFKSLNEVIMHYDKGIVHGDYLDPLLDKPELGLSSTDIYDLAAFLNTLTDSSFIHNPDLSKP